MSKIHLSMRLAELDDRGGASGGGGGAPGSPLQSNEEGFAQSVMARRVSTAEQEVEELQRQLQEAEVQISQLEFQVGNWEFSEIETFPLHVSAQLRDQFHFIYHSPKPNDFYGGVFLAS
jgi:hypothetical protein